MNQTEKLQYTVDQIMNLFPPERSGTNRKFVLCLLDDLVATAPITRCAYLSANNYFCKLYAEDCHKILSTMPICDDFEASMEESK